MSLKKLLETPRAVEISDKSKPIKLTDEWKPKVEHNDDGSTTIVTVDNESLTYDELLVREGFDPKKYMLAPHGVQTKAWDALRRVWVEDDSESGGHHETEKVRMNGYKLTVVERPVSVDVNELCDLVTNQKPPTAAVNYNGDKTFLFALGDTQFFKYDGDGIEGQIGRFHEVVHKAISECHSTPGVSKVLIAFMGDMCEMFVSQGGKNAWRTTATITEQLRLMRRAYLMVIDAFIDAGYSDIDVVACSGNHGDTIRQPIQTRQDDNYDTDSLVAVADAMELNPGRYGRVNCYVPGADEFAVCLDVRGVNVAFQHGHQFRANKHWDWWAGQALGQTDVGKCTVLLTGHHHHYQVEERDVRTFITTPALEEVSVWWKTKTGTTGHPGAVVGYFQDGEIENVHKIHAKYRGSN